MILSLLRCPTFRGHKSVVELDRKVTGFAGCECKMFYIERRENNQCAAECNKNFPVVSREIKKCTVSCRENYWRNPSDAHPCAASCKILRKRACCMSSCGRMYCDEPQSPVKFNQSDGTIQDKTATARLRKGQETEFRIDPTCQARMISISISKFVTPKNETTMLDLYEGHDILSNTPMRKWSQEKRPSGSKINVFVGAATLSVPSCHINAVHECMKVF